MALLFLSLPLVKVNVYTTVRGVIKPDAERFVLRSNVGGQVVHSQLIPNKTVIAGDILLRLSHPLLDEKKAFLIEHLEEHEDYLRDLSTLNQKSNAPHLGTALYQKQWNLFLAGEKEWLVKKQKATHVLERATVLFKKDIISKVKWEEAKHAAIYLLEMSLIILQWVNLYPIWIGLFLFVNLLEF